ncbi:ABC transporter permease [uncultured Clostridium sp.]|uniref:ABC transporter permease n=1 Tax=uncultured Clostridium sp. TaxID=59620 RepID=UPI0025CFA47D|nr:ABC transporter permease [uncultured Clostridium sp.]
MIINMYKKELKSFFRNKSNVIFMFLVPLFLILIMSVALKSYMSNTDKSEYIDGKILYIMNDSEENKNKFEQFKTYIQEKYEIVFEESNSYDDAVKAVNRQEAYSVITINKNDFEYYRSPYNEKTEATVIRKAFDEMIGNDSYEELSNNQINTVELEEKSIDSNGYFTFAELSFIMLYIAMIIAHSVFEERELGTINRITLSKAKIQSMLFSKLLLGVTIGILQIVEVYIFSTLALKVDWGKNSLFIALILLFICIFSSAFGILTGVAIKNKLMIDNTVLMTAIFIGFLGGAFSPVTMLEEVPIVSWVIKVSPLYWTNKAFISLCTGIFDSNSIIALAICVALTIILLISCGVVVNAKKFKGGLKNA